LVCGRRSVLFASSQNHLQKMNLLSKKCVPCEGGVQPLGADEIAKYLSEIHGWKNIENKKIRKEFVLPNFLKTIAFVDKIALLAENEGHHPDMIISYNNLAIEIFTHAVGGLSENDFILAAKIDELLSSFL